MLKPEGDISERVGTSVSLAAEYLRQGKLIGFPTETYYGIGVDPENGQSVAQVFKIKKRTIKKPLLVLIESRQQLENLVEYIPRSYYRLMDQYWPGALTLIFPAKASVIPGLTAHTGTIGIRLSPHPLAKALIQAVGKPITATSANISGRPAAQSAGGVLNMFGNNLDYILDGGKTAGGASSTVVAEEKGRLVILRKGQINIDSCLL